jgi:surface antigen Omp85-like protein
MGGVGVLGVWLACLGAVPAPATTGAQEPQTRQGVIEQQQAERAKKLQPQEPNKGEQVVARIEDMLMGGGGHWYPFFSNAYSGGGFALGLGYRQFVSPYNTLAVQGSYSVANYKRIEAVFTAPRLFNRRGQLVAIGGWREATQVGFYGLGMETAKEDRANFGFTQPYVSAALRVRPTRRTFVVGGGLEITRWSEQPGAGRHPSIETVYTPAELPGIGAEPAYVHSHVMAGFDWRPAAGYARRGGFYETTLHDFTDPDKAFGFQQIDYELVQHIPILREAWVISLRSAIRTTHSKSGQEIPFFMLPGLGGGSNLRGYSSFRFRDRNGMLLQAEWRITASRYLDSAIFYDAGKVTAHTSDLDFNGLESDVGFGVRFHGPLTTPLRIDVAKGREGFVLVFATSAVF